MHKFYHYFPCYKFWLIPEGKNFPQTHEVHLNKAHNSTSVPKNNRMVHYCIYITQLAINLSIRKLHYYACMEHKN